MRIALLDPLPRVGHDATWIRHTAAALTATGHEPVTVSSTKSGRALTSWGTPKWGTSWSPYTPDVVVKDEDLAAELATYDRVVLVNAACPDLDTPAVKKNTMPAYVYAVHNLEKPWLAVLQPGVSYSNDNAPCLTSLLDNPHGRLITHNTRPEEPYSGEIEARKMYAPLPFLGVLPDDAPIPEGATVGTTGVLRSSATSLAASSIHLPAETIIELWGASETGVRANASYKVLEALLPYTTAIERRAGQDPDAPAPFDAPHGAKDTPYTWDARIRSGALVRYLGNYVDTTATASRCAIWASTSWLDEDGLPNDYPTLEALNAGSVCLLNGGQLNSELMAMLHPDSAGGGQVLPDAEQTGVALNKLVKALNNTPWRTKVAATNRAALREAFESTPFINALTS